MKRIFTIGFVLITLTKVFAQPTLSENEKLYSLCQIWGFLKYYHPIVAKGKFDWDFELRKHIRVLDHINTKDELDSLYLDWIRALGKIKDCKRHDENYPEKSIISNLDTTWLNDTKLYSDTLIKTIHFIRKNRNRGRNYYVSRTLFVGNTKFKNETLYRDSIFPSSELRLICLFRYWNVINYFFPYKYLTDENWNNVLKEMIPKFRYAQDTIEYFRTMRELTVKINDGHATLFINRPIKFVMATKRPPFETRIIESKAFINSIYNDSLAHIDDIRFGDIILKAGNKTISEIVREKTKYYEAANEDAMLYYIGNLLFNGSSDTLQITYEREGIVSTKVIHRYFEYDVKYKRKQENPPLSKIIDGEVGYINLRMLEEKEVKKVITPLLSCKGIIFDLRDYPNITYEKVSRYLNKVSIPFAKCTSALINYPGLFRESAQVFTGCRKKKYYKGKVAIIVNEHTISRGEFVTMALMASPNAKVIGNNTAGSDGNVSELYLPGEYLTKFSGIGVYFPDGQETQRIGIVPDIKIKPTINGVRNKEDELLNRAIKYINEDN